MAASAITSRTKAIIPVHLYGQMCDMAAYADLAAAHPGVAIIEDAAHAFESRRDGIPPGAESDAAIFSFYATKNVTCAEGGAVITRRDDLSGWVGETRLHGMSAGAADRFREGQYRHWDMMRLGTKANLPDVLAALLPEQIRGVFDRLAQREALAKRYEAALAGTGVTTPKVLPDSVHARHLFPVHVPPGVRDEALFRLGAARVGATVNYHAVPTTAYYGERFPDASVKQSMICPSVLRLVSFSISTSAAGAASAPEPTRPLRISTRLIESIPRSASRSSSKSSISRG